MQVIKTGSTTEHNLTAVNIGHLQLKLLDTAMIGNIKVVSNQKSWLKLANSPAQKSQMVKYGN